MDIAALKSHLSEFFAAALEWATSPQLYAQLFFPAGKPRGALGFAALV